MNYESLLQELGLDNSTAQKQQYTSKSPQNQTRVTQNTYTSKSPESQKKIKLVLNVNLSSNQTKQLTIYQDDDPKIKVSEFCHTYQLDQKAQNALIKQINSNISPDKYSTKSKSNYYSKQQFQSYSTKDSAIPGERLYKLAEKKKEQRENLIKQYQTEKQDQEDQQLRSTPKLSKQTQIILQQVGYRKNGYMQDKGTLKDKQVQQIYLDEEGKEYKFIPEINDLSKQMSHFIREKQHYENVFDELYEQARNRMYSQPEYEISECTFKPNVNQNYQFDEDFLTRMEKKQAEQKEKMELIKMKYENVDLKTRQLLYRPKICRSPFSQSYSEKPVHEKLFLQSKLKQNKMQIMSEQKVKDENEQLNIRMKNELSEDIVFLQRKRTLKQIFIEMDINQDGYIKCTYEEINNLQPNIIQVLWPILKKIQEQNWELDFNDFFEIIYDYCLTLTQSQKNVIFKRQKNSKSEIERDSQCTFTPKTNKKSKAMNTAHYPSCKCEICQEIAQITSKLNEK